MMYPRCSRLHLALYLVRYFFILVHMPLLCIIIIIIIGILFNVMKRLFIFILDRYIS